MYTLIYILIIKKRGILKVGTPLYVAPLYVSLLLSISRGQVGTPELCMFWQDSPLFSTFTGSSTTIPFEIIMPFIPGNVSYHGNPRFSRHALYPGLQYSYSLYIRASNSILYPVPSFEILSQLNSRSNVCKIRYILSFFEHSFHLLALTDVGNFCE